MSVTDATIQLAQDQCLAHAAKSLDLFGHVTLRQIFAADEVAAICSGLDELDAGLSSARTITTVSPVEKSRQIQDVVFSAALHQVLSKVLPPFWYFSSDAYVGGPVFPPHRDTFLNPPFIKIFIPLVPCTFFVIQGSHHYHDRWARDIGKYATDWDSGAVKKTMQDISFNASHGKIVSQFNHLKIDDLFTRSKLSPGDVFIFNQNCVHALNADPELGRNFFAAVSVVPSPAASGQYGMTRSEHLDQVILNISGSSACEYQLSNFKGVAADDCLFQGYKFSIDDLDRLAPPGNWNDCFGLRLINKEKWREAFDKLKYKGFQVIQDCL